MEATAGYLGPVEGHLDTSFAFLKAWLWPTSAAEQELDFSGYLSRGFAVPFWQFMEATSGYLEPAQDHFKAPYALLRPCCGQQVLGY